MYSRYVPPAKGGNAPSSAPAQAVNPSNTQSPAPEPNAPAPSIDGLGYSRYIPGSKPVSKPAEPATVRFFDDEPSLPTPKRKRDFEEETQTESKKPKKFGQDHAVNEVSVPSPVPEAQDSSKKGRKKKRTRKNKRRTAASSDEDSDDESEAEPEPPKVEEPKVVGEVEEPKPRKVEKEKKDKKKKKKEKKRKEKKRKEEEEEQSPETNIDEPEADVEPQDVSMVDAEDVSEQIDEVVEPDELIEKEQKEKRKREKKKKQKESEPAEEETNEADQRHKAVLERKAKSLKLASERPQVEEEEEDLGPLHGLEPLPQPAPVEIDNARPTYETLPSWLAEPIRVSQDTRTPFTELGLLPKASRVLEEKGFKDAFAVQTAALPLLLPTSKRRPGDVLISAATGSGKTLAYALPITRDISQGVVTRLRVLVVLPTRELVKQAQDVFELCAKAYEGGDRKRVRIGISIGSQSLKHEQEWLMDKELRYDPETYKKLQEELQARRDGLLDLESEEADPRLGTMDGYVVDFSSKVDVLICTPGRLVEHMEQTPGFSLDYVRWLVVDEADKLLAQSFQGWLDLAMEKFKINRFSARDFPDMDLSGVRKVILSATLTRDLSLLNQLNLRRPSLIVLESDGAVEIAEHSLPTLLKEFAIRVHDTNLKPLYLLELLQGQHMLVASPDNEKASELKPEEASDSDTSSMSSSESDSDSDATSDTSSDSDSDVESPSPARTRKHNLPISLIFTKSNESALRLSRLLTLLDPSLSTHIGTLTSTTPTHIRRKTLRAFTTQSSPIRLLIASDLVARGIDLPNLDHVINYDLPPSLAGYVHRVGRTARAGRSGCAWTLVDDGESGWFWGKIAKGSGVRRAQKVERTRIEEMGEERVEMYEAALEKLGQEARR